MNRDSGASKRDANSKPRSKFADLLGAARDEGDGESETGSGEPRIEEGPISEAVPNFSTPTPHSLPTTPSRRGRPAGKRSDPTFTQVTAYIRADTHRRVKLALLMDPARPEFSDLVEELLREWLARRDGAGS